MSHFIRPWTYVAGAGRHGQALRRHGDDTLPGGAKVDTFYYKTGWGTDTNTDFDAKGRVHDVLDLGGVKSIRNSKDLRKNHLEIDGDDIVIDAGNGDMIRLEGVARGDIDTGDFLF